MATPDELRSEAAAAETLAAIVSYAPDKEWLRQKAHVLRHLADRQEQTANRREPDARS